MSAGGRRRALVEPGEHEALQLAVTRPVGRIAFVRNELLFVTPVNFLLEGRDVLLRTAEQAELLAAAREGAAGALEVDDLEGWSRSGWCVLIRGRLSAVTDTAEVVRVHERGPTPWAEGEREHVVRLAGGQVTGRRIAPGPGGVSVLRL